MKRNIYIFVLLLFSVVFVYGQTNTTTQKTVSRSFTVQDETDDASENSAGAMTLDGAFLWLGGSTSGKLRAIRFGNVVIPDNAVIQDAYIQFHAYGSSPVAGANISVEIGNASTYSSSSKSISSRKYSTRKANWSNSSSLSEKKIIRTPNLNSIIDENRAKGWKSGQSMAFKFDGLKTNQGLTVYAYEGGSNYRPQLIVNYYINDNFRHLEMSESVVAASRDDASESRTGSMVLNGEYLWLGGSESGNLRTVRFTNVDIPATASIIDAYIEFYAYGDSPAAISNIYTELGNSSVYTTGSKNISSRKYTQTRIVWDSPSLTAKNPVRTPNLQSIIDESRAKGWSSKQSMAFKFEGLDINMGTTVYAYDGEMCYRPKLVVRYINDGRGPNPPEAPISIACVGNSISYGYGLQFQNIHCYPSKLEKELGAGYDITNLGHNGAAMLKVSLIPYWKTANYAKAKTLNPDIFIIELGSNDANVKNWSSNIRELYKQAYKEMIAELKAAAVGKTPRFLICTPCYVDPKGTTGISGATIRDILVPAVREVAEELGIEVIDFYELTYGHNEYYFDGLHPDRYTADMLAKLAAMVVKKEASQVLPHAIRSVVSAAKDDGSENNAGAMTLDGAFLWLGGSQSGHLRAVRFNNINLPENAIIEDAYIEFYAYGNSPGANIFISSETGNAKTYATTSKNMSSRNYTTAKIKWEAPALTAKQKINTPTLKNIIDENRNKGWKPGQSMAFSFKGLGSNEGTTVYAYEGEALYRPRLVIKYTLNGTRAAVYKTEIVDSQTPIETSFEKEMDIHIYPNPANDLLYINTNNSAPKAYTAKIYTTNGSFVLQKELDSYTNAIDVTKLSSGLYILQITDSDSNIQSFRFVKQ